MEDNSYYGSYEENNRKSPLLIMLLIIIAIAAIIAIIIFIVNAFLGSNFEKKILVIGKDYYKNSYTISNITNCNETPPSGA
jgi:uncharacterized membrane protein YqiK